MYVYPCCALLVVQHEEPNRSGRPFRKGLAKPVDSTPSSLPLLLTSTAPQQQCCCSSSRLGQRWGLPHCQVNRCSQMPACLPACLSSPAVSERVGDHSWAHSSREPVCTTSAPMPLRALSLTHWRCTAATCCLAYGVRIAAEGSAAHDTVHATLHGYRGMLQSACNVSRCTVHAALHRTAAFRCDLLDPLQRLCFVLGHGAAQCRLLRSARGRAAA
jgi:hypothetical protein